MLDIEISIAVVVKNEAKQISDLLESLLVLNSPLILEVLVVDNNSSDNTREIVMNWMENHPQLPLQLLSLKSNHMAVARNLALQKAKGNWVYFTDADCRVLPQGWQAALSFLKGPAKDEQTAAFGGGNVTPLSQSFVSQGLQALSLNWFGHMGSIQVSTPKILKQTCLLSTCNMFVKRSWALKTTGCSLAFSSVGEDMSLCYELRKAGGILFAVPDMEVLHLQDCGALNWYKKMFSYGKAQILTATKYPAHFWGVRGIQFIFMFIAMFIAVGLPQVFMGLILFYLGLLILGSLRGRSTLQSGLIGVFFILTSQMSYGIGELAAAFSLVSKKLFIFPKNNPDLEKT